MSGDHHFPRFHVRPPSGYVNDPNGPVLLDGRWHLYFQYVHDTPRRGPVVWGHASSPDLATWSLHRPAMAPLPGGVDGGGCWSGNTVVSGDELVAFYSGYRAGHPYQSVVAAVSRDGGASFGAPGQVVADPSPGEHVAQFRDPFVWREDGGWLMLVGAGTRDGTACARLYESTDLRTWRYRGPFAEGVDTGEMWECPQLLSFGGRDALLVSAYDGRRGIGAVFTLTGGREDGRLRDPVVSPLDVGANLYAASVARDTGAGAVVWGWATEGRSTEWTVEADWSGMITLPRTATPTPDGRLALAPVAALTSLRRAAVPAGTTDGLPAQLEVVATLRGTGVTVLSLRCGRDEHLDVTVDRDAATVTVDRDAASTDPRADGGAYTFDEPGLRSPGGLTLRWFVDGSISELFTGSGRCSTVRFYPTTPPPWDLRVTGLGDADTVEVWPLAEVTTGT